MGGSSNCGSVNQTCSSDNNCCGTLSCVETPKGGTCTNCKGEACVNSGPARLVCCGNGACPQPAMNCDFCLTQDQLCLFWQECCSGQCNNLNFTCFGGPSFTLAPSSLTEVFTIFRDPTFTPTSQRPSKAPTTTRPSRAPSKTPITGSPSKASTTTRPSKAPTTTRPSKVPTTTRPSKAPTSPRPSKSPSLIPTTSKPSHQPSKAPTSVPSLSPSRSPSGSPFLWPSSSPNFLPSLRPVSFTPSAAPSMSAIMPSQHSNTVPPATIPGTAAFVGAFIALAAIFLLVRRRGRVLQYKSVEDLRQNRKFASRKSISAFMARLEKDKEDFLVDPRRLDLGRVIGIGSHGVVYEGRYQGEEVAVKELLLEDDEKEAKDSRQRFLQEMLALHRLRHPNIVRLIGVGALQSDANLSRTFFFVMELAKCSLRDVMQDDSMRIDISTLPKSLSLARQICDGLAYMHHMELIHLDLKPENILITETGTAKICDLGLSEVACSVPLKNEAGEDAVDPTKQELQGTSPYIAPELVVDYRKDAPKYLVTYSADVYSFGMVLWELLHAPLPSHPLSWDPYRILVEVKYNNYRPRIDSAIPEGIASMIRKCWATNPKDRPELYNLSVEIGLFIDDFVDRRTSTTLVVSNEFRQREFSRSAML